jgi:hypothetical protein
MYCRYTTDAATEYLARLRHLAVYFNSWLQVDEATA